MGAEPSLLGEPPSWTGGMGAEPSLLGEPPLWTGGMGAEPSLLGEPPSWTGEARRWMAGSRALWRALRPDGGRAVRPSPAHLPPKVMMGPKSGEATRSLRSSPSLAFL